MLSFLHIENIAVIKRLDIDLDGGFTAITGETGAGKSMIIDAICLVMGSRGSKELIRSGENCARVNALFCALDEQTLEELKQLDVEPDEEGVISLSRTVFADGRTQAKINSQSVQVSHLREVASHLIGLQSQHESRILLDAANHIKYLDTYVGDTPEVCKARKEYGECLAEYKRYKARCESLAGSREEKERMRELLEYQIKDIDALSLKAGEDEKLEERRKKLQNAEKLVKGTEFVSRALTRSGGGLCAADLMEKAAGALRKLAEYEPEALELAERLEEYRYEIVDIGERVRDFAPDDVSDPSGELDRIESRLEAISRLKRKYGQSVDDILEFRERAVRELDEIENNEELIKEANALCAESATRLEAAARILHELRADGAKRLEEGIERELEYLDMKGARFKINVSEAKSVDSYNELGGDNVEFLIAANLGEELKPMSKTASGGELSRVMLALKSELAGKGDAGTVIFDEIDTGVSGKTCEKIGLKLRRISEGAQVLCITHSAQVAALADAHLRISKAEKDGRNETMFERLDFEGRVRETARITSGVNISEKQLEAARELVNASRRK